MSISDMERTLENVFSLLKPGGTLVFSVPHPFMASRHGTKSIFGFEGGHGGYFSLRDKVLDGHTESLNLSLNDKWADFDIHKKFDEYNTAIA